MPTKKPKTLTPQDARSTALRALSRREHSAAQLAQKLQRRGHDAETAQSTLDEMNAAGWQSDERYAEVLLRSRVDQGYGPLRIRADLQAARVDEVRIAEAFAAAEIDWLARCHAAYARRFREPAQTPRVWQQQYRFLAYRGFEPEQIRQVLRHGDQLPDEYV